MSATAAAIEIIDLTRDNIIISIDVGEVNLAYCVLDLSDVSKVKVIDWKRVEVRIDGKSVSPETIGLPISNLIKKLVNLYSADCIHALIEKQLRYQGNPATQYRIFLNGVVESALHTAFQMVGITALSMNPKEVKQYHGIQGQTREQKKADAVNLVHELIETDAVEVTDEIRQYFLGSSKKDDLAECFLQALAYWAF